MEDEQSPAIQTNLSLELINFLEENCDELTIDFLKQVHELKLEFKTSNPDKDFVQYIRDLKNSKYADDFDNLKLAKQQAELKFQLLRKRYDEEIEAFNTEAIVTNLLENNGHKAYSGHIKERDRLLQNEVKSLKEELESMRRQMDEWRDKCKEAEKRCNNYQKELKGVRTRREHSVPSLSELAYIPQQTSQTFNLDSTDMSPPPPPKIDVPLNEILGEEHLDPPDY